MRCPTAAERLNLCYKGEVTEADAANLQRQIRYINQEATIIWPERRLDGVPVDRTFSSA